jgi:hypothetical protein
MIDSQTLHKLQKAGIQVDMLGRKIKVGDTVLCKGYRSQDKDTFAVVKRVNPKSVVIDLDKGYYDWGQYVHNPTKDPNHIYYPDRKYISTTEETRRRGLEMLIIPHDLHEQAMKEGEQTINDHPEIFI